MTLPPPSLTLSAAFPPGRDTPDHVALAEDLGTGLPGGGHDVTSESVIPAETRFAGVMDSRDPIVVAGLPIAAAFFRSLIPAWKSPSCAPRASKCPPEPT